MTEVYTRHGANGRGDPTDLHQPKRIGETRRLTDLGNAERFVDDHKRYVRYCYPWNSWLIFDGTRWAIDDSGEVEHLMKKTVRGIYAEAASESDDSKRKEINDHARRSEARKRQTDAVFLARSELSIRPEEMDCDRHLLNCTNGTVDLRAGQLRKHERDDYITKLAPVPFDLFAKAPTFDAFLEKILPSVELRNFVQTVVGYAAIGVNTEEVLTILYGHGANGKSTLVNAVMEALGEYSAQAAPDLLLAKKGAHPTELADLFGKRFVASVETDDGRYMNEGLVKQLTGRDKIKARRMREDFWEFDPTHTLFLATNHRPEVRGTDHAIWRRLKLVPFDVAISREEQDKKLPEKLRDELPGILAWVVRGALMYQKRGLPEPDQVRAATAGYRAEMDVLAAFIEDRCVVNDRAKVGATPLYHAYKDWCEDTGERAETQTKFGRRLSERGFVREKYQTITWHGIGLRSDQDDPDPGPDEGPRGPDEGDNGLTLDGSQEDHLSDESRIDIPNSEDGAERVRGSRPENDINGNNPPHEAAISEEGLKPSKPSKPSSQDQGAVTNAPDSLAASPRRLTAEAVQEVRRLVEQGMKPNFAREAVLRKGNRRA